MTADTFRPVSASRRKTGWIAKYFFKPRLIFSYSTETYALDDSIHVTPLMSLSPLYRELRKTPRLETLVNKRSGSNSWLLFFFHDTTSILGYSFLHIPYAAAEWYDSLPTIPGEARLCSSFVEPEFRGSGIRGLILLQQKSYCAEHKLYLWSVIENSNSASLQATAKSAGTPIRKNYLIKFFKRNIISIITRPLRIYPLYRSRRRQW
jgi:hypothetical protein